jgi:hypothetical protein
MAVSENIDSESVKFCEEYLVAFPRDFDIPDGANLPRFDFKETVFIVKKSFNHGAS